MKKNFSIRVKGIVQGVGFRPFIYQIAEKYGLSGCVINDTEGVLIEIEGHGDSINKFIHHIKNDSPSLAYVMEVTAEEGTLEDFEGFSIKKSRITEERVAFYSPDVAVCDECLNEFFDPGDRRYHYPFITCINCGPRFSIIKDIPYDRHNTSMDPFEMCDKCSSEYNFPSDRRFHTQPDACSICGPLMSLYDSRGNEISSEINEIAEKTVKFLREGQVLAIKGVGGYLLAVDAENDSAVEKLRKRKRRPFKPFALMAGSIESAERFVRISDRERSLLISKERPIVLLEKSNEVVSRSVAPGMSNLGVMLPYLPFQHLLFSIESDMVLVMTSGNLSDEPIVFRDGTAFDRFSEVADYIISFNREILAQSDDSVLFVEDEKPYFIRRARGYVPLPFKSKEIDCRMLATGGDLKNSFAIARNDFVIMSQYLGDMADPLTGEAFIKTVEHFFHIFDARPDVVVSDMHPGYHTTSYCDELESDLNIRRIRVQHHHAHIASVLEDQNIDGPVIGIAFDGTGYGTDGRLWGSEFLIADRKAYERAAHFSYFPLPGGEKAIRDVWKIGLSLLYKKFGHDIPLMEKTDMVRNLMEIMDKGINSPETCSIGRIFDGISSILGISSSISTEAEAAILLEESALKGNRDVEPFIIPFTGEDPMVISTEELTAHVVSLIEKGLSVEDISYAFHSSIAHTAFKVVSILRDRHGINSVALSGGVFHNRILLRLMKELLNEGGFDVHVPEKVPFNDGCIALGQIAVAKEHLYDS